MNACIQEVDAVDAAHNPYEERPCRQPHCVHAQLLVQRKEYVCTYRHKSEICLVDILHSKTHPLIDFSHSLVDKAVEESIIFLG